MLSTDWCVPTWAGFFTLLDPLMTASVAPAKVIAAAHAVVPAIEVSAIKRARLEPNTANALLNSLKFQLELIVRFEIGEQFAEYERQISILESRIEALVATARTGTGRAS
jgi:hypothetical protein